MTNVHWLHPVSPIGHYLRIGHTGHQQLENILQSGRLEFSRFVVDAAHAGKQAEFLASLRANGCELVLDTKFAELATPGGYRGAAKVLPWAGEYRPYLPEDFTRDQRHKTCRQIAKFAVKFQVSAVLAPTHLIEDAHSRWLMIDRALVHDLRNSLDQYGGSNIEIDYPLMFPYQLLLDVSARRRLIGELAKTEFDYLWLRVANFGGDKSPAGIRKYINALRDFHSLGRPILADGVGGLAAVAISAFGASSGLSHGVAQNERFDTKSWISPRPSTSKQKFGSRTRVYLANIDQFTTPDQAQTIMSARGAKSLLGCRDAGCCPNGWQDMLDNPKRHYLAQTGQRIQHMEKIPELSRVDDFLSQTLAAADRDARKAASLRIDDEKILEKLAARSRRSDDMRRVLEELRANDDNPSRALSTKMRSNRINDQRGAEGKA